MVTARQMGRGLSRGLRAMEREAQRNQRQRIAYQKSMAKQAMLDASADAARTYDQYLQLLTRSHQTTFVRRDWAEIALAAPPIEPVRTDDREQAAAAALERYTPGWFARTFGLAKGARARLAAAVDRARHADDDAHAQATRVASKRRDEITIAQAVVAGEPAALNAALTEYADFTSVAIEGLEIMHSDGRVIAIVDGLEMEDIPTHSITLLQSGKASRKALAASKVLELHRDNICSSAVRVAAEFLMALPLEAVEVVVNSDMLDRATGHVTAEPVLYARITSQALAAVNLEMAEATPLAERLGAHFDWSRRDGLRAINVGAFDVPLKLLT